MPLILFDLDGTLVDSAPDLCASLNRIRRSEGLDDLPFDVLREYAGAGARGLLKIGFDLTPDSLRKLLSALEQKGWEWGIVTNKFRCFTIPILQKLELLDRASVVVCGDETGKLKPNPDNLIAALEKARARAALTPYVGDDIRDSQAAAKLGMPFAAALWGYLRTDFPVHALKDSGLLLIKPKNQR